MSKSNNLHAVAKPLNWETKPKENSIIIVRKQVTIKTSADVIWNLLTNFTGWADWNPAVKKVRIVENTQATTVIKWQVGHAKIKSTIKSVVPYRELSWSGMTLGIQAVHSYQLTEVGNSTIIESTVYWDGILPKLFRRRMQIILEKSVLSGLEALTVVSEGIDSQL